MARSMLQRLHNPKDRVCGCIPECFCQRSRAGRLLRWYLPRGVHKSVPPEYKQAREFRQRFG